MNLTVVDAVVVVLVVLAAIVVALLVAMVRMARWEAEKARHEAEYVQAATTPAVER